MTAPIPNTPTETPPDVPALDSASIANLTASLRADYNALQNDLEQAQEMAADFQRQLAGKSNEVAHFKVLLEKTLQDLARMEGHTSELRQERHRLANEVMIAAELKERVKDLSAERDQIRKELEVLRAALTSANVEHQEQIKKKDIEVNRLRAALEAARASHENAVSAGGQPAASVRDRISELSATVERLESIIRERPAKSGPASKSDSGFIDISFDS
jgi:chromosome segregation ATPase